jgi:hypothetical protein
MCYVPTTSPAAPAQIYYFGLHGQADAPIGCGCNLGGYTYFKDTGGYDLMSFHSA